MIVSVYHSPSNGGGGDVSQFMPAWINICCCYFGHHVRTCTTIGKNRTWFLSPNAAILSSSQSLAIMHDVLPWHSHTKVISNSWLHRYHVSDFLSGDVVSVKTRYCSMQTYCHDSVTTQNIRGKIFEAKYLRQNTFDLWQRTKLIGIFVLKHFHTWTPSLGVVRSTGREICTEMGS